MGKNGAWCVQSSHLHFGVDAVGDLVSDLAGAGVRLGQQERVRQRAILWLHDLQGRQSEAERGSESEEEWKTSKNRRTGGKS